MTSRHSNTENPDAEVAERLSWAVEIARSAGQETLRWFRDPNLAVEMKGDGSPVTVADRAAEQLLRDAIASRFPNDAVLGEEFGDSAGDSAYQWTLDPIDGTKTFVAGVPLYCTLVAVLRGGSSVAGVIYAPATDEMVYAAAGGPCWRQAGGGAAVESRVSPTTKLDEALFVTTSAQSFVEYRDPPAMDVFERLGDACRLTRTWGDAYGYLLVAAGRADVMIDPIVNLWDAAPLEPVIEAAGGRFTDWRGARGIHAGEAIATNGHLHDAVVELVNL